MNTAGLDQFKRSNSGYYKDANGFLLVYDVTDKSSLYTIPQHEKYVRELLTTNVPPPILMIGEKIYDISTCICPDYIWWRFVSCNAMCQIWVLVLPILKSTSVFLRNLLGIHTNECSCHHKRVNYCNKLIWFAGGSLQNLTIMFSQVLQKERSVCLPTIAQKVGSILDRLSQSGKQFSCRKIPLWGRLTGPKRASVIMTEQFATNQKISSLLISWYLIIYDRDVYDILQ